MRERNAALNREVPAQLSTLRMLADQFPASPQGMQALYRLGQEWSDLDQWTLAASAYNDLATRYPANPARRLVGAGRALRAAAARRRAGQGGLRPGPVDVEALSGRAAQAAPVTRRTLARRRLDADVAGDDIERHHGLAAAERRLRPPRAPRRSWPSAAICEVTVPFSASAITRASAGVSAKTSRTSPLKARSRISPSGVSRACSTVTSPMPVSSRSVPLTRSA